MMSAEMKIDLTFMFVVNACNQEFDDPIMNYDYSSLEKMDRDEMRDDEYRNKMASIPFG